MDLRTNYRCPAPVVERAVRLVAINGERFAKRIEPRPGAAGRLVLAPDAGDESVRLRRVLLAFGSEDGTTRAVLARTNRELLPAAAAALALGIAFRAAGLTLLVESPLVDELIAAARPDRPALVALAAVVAEERRAAAGRIDPSTTWTQSATASPSPAHSSAGAHRITTSERSPAPWRMRGDG